MDTKTKIQITLSIVLVTAVSAILYWIQLPAQELKAQVIDTDTTLVRMQDFAFDPDVVRIEAGTTVTWLNDETGDNSGVQHAVTSYDPDDVTTSGEVFESDLLSQGDTFSYTFGEDGVFNYNCSVHPFMIGKICVGEASEILDEECNIDITDTGGEIVDEEIADEDLLGTEGDAGDTDGAGLVGDETRTGDTEEDEFADLGLTGEVDEPVLFEAADEDSDMDGEEMDSVATTSMDEDDSGRMVLTYADDGMVDTGEAEGTEMSGEELADSGPEHYIYVFILLFALYASKRINFSKTS